jgi:uncharacterized protein
MGKNILLEIGGKKFNAKLYEGKAPEDFAAALPKEFGVSRWGDEYYGSCGVSLKEDSTVREIMEVGELAYWKPGSAFCIFFGPTPASTDSRPRAASNVIPLGKIEGDVSTLKSVGASAKVKITQI